MAEPGADLSLGPEPEADVEVAAKTVVAESVVALELRPAGAEALPHWDPGAHIDLMLPDRPTRQYSLCGDQDDRERWRLGILRDPQGQGSSLYVHDELAVGDVVRIRGPRNNFPLHEAARYLFIAGGIGITPMLPMVASVTAAGRDWQMVYGGRRRASMAFLPELAAYGDRVTVCPEDEVGLLELEGLLAEPQAETLIYCCGPEPLLEAVQARTSAWPHGALHLERFKPKPQEGVGPRSSFEVVLQRRGVTLTVPPDQSILEVMDAAGIAALHSCAEGICGTCEVRVLEGEPDHRDSVLTDDERAANDCMMICVSRSRTPRLVLDL